jgi:hypothetical protein
MNYQETTEWMFNQLPMYQLQGASAYKRFNKHPPTSQSSW